MTPATVLFREVFSRVVFFRSMISHLALIASLVALSASTGRGEEIATATSVKPQAPAIAATDLGPATDLTFGTGNTLLLRGRDAQRQLAITAKFSAGQTRDVTRQITYSSTPAGIVSVDKSGLATPLADGQAKIIAQGPDGLQATADVTVDHFVDDPQINFPNQIVPIFTKLGCNSGGCHGKASGQNGFKLSLLGFEPGEDYEHLVKEARGRRLFPAAPDRSLLLTKPIGAIPHGGGKRLDRDSLEYRLLGRWIAQGMPYGKDTDPTVARHRGSARATP